MHTILLKGMLNGNADDNTFLTQKFLLFFCLRFRFSWDCIFEMPKYKKYPQKFRDNWLTEESLKSWLCSVRGDDKKAFCRHCKCYMMAKYGSFKQHSVTKKHKYACQVSNRNMDVKMITAKGNQPLKTLKSSCIAYL